MSGGASSSGAISNPAGLEVFNATEVDVESFPMSEDIPSFEEERIGTPKTVNLVRVRLSSGEAVPAFASNIHLMGESCSPSWTSRGARAPM